MTIRFVYVLVMSLGIIVFQQPAHAASQGGTVMKSGNTGSMSSTGMMGDKLMMPKMDPARGRMLYASKGCVVCHMINGIGGDDAPSLEAKTMQPHMDPFDFAARMWRGAEMMIAMQRNELGKQVEFTGDEHADIIAFAHSPEEQKKFSEADIPPQIKKMMDK